jgi:hypothetical protein
MIGEAAGHASGGGNDEDIAVAVVFSGEGDQGAVGREIWKGLDTHAGSEAVSVAAVAADDPEIVGVIESDLRLADGGETKQERRIGLG